MRTWSSAWRMVGPPIAPRGGTSLGARRGLVNRDALGEPRVAGCLRLPLTLDHDVERVGFGVDEPRYEQLIERLRQFRRRVGGDRKSTRLNSSHRCISYAVF